MENYPVLSTVGSSLNNNQTLKTVGAGIMSVAPYLATIPVIGWVGTAIAEVVGFALIWLGTGWNESTGVRWLTAYFEWGVLGDSSVTSDNHIHEKNVPIAAAWFLAVLGVPCYDRYRFAALRGFDAGSGQLLNNTLDQRAGLYIQFPEISKMGVTFDQAYAAAQIAATMKWPMTGAPGCWAQMTVAPSLVDNGNPTVTQVTVFLNKWKYFLIGGAALLWYYFEED